MGMDRLDCTHKKMDAQSFTQHGRPWHTMMQWWGHPKLEVSIRTFFFAPFGVGRICMRSPFYTHESGKRTKPGRIKRAPCDSQQRLGGSPGWVKCGDWKAARFSFLSSYVSVCLFNYLLYLLLLYFVFIIVIIFSKVYLSLFIYIWLLRFLNLFLFRLIRGNINHQNSKIVIRAEEREDAGLPGSTGIHPDQPSSGPQNISGSSFLPWL